MASGRDRQAAPRKLGGRRFQMADQESFAALSGDYNPIHLDVVAARRTLAGQVIVHGVHSVLWALETLALETGIGAGELDIKFSKPIYVDEDLECLWDEARSRLVLAVASTPVVQIRIKPGDFDPVERATLPLASPLPAPLEPSKEDFADTRDRDLHYRGQASRAAGMFPTLCTLLGEGRVCDTSALSELVGMHVPGLHSLFAALTLKFQDDGDTPSTYAIANYEPRLNMVTVQARARSLQADITAFERPRAARIATMQAIADRVGRDTFSGVDALVVGGSRGLGEAAAKIIASGGGKVTITHATGKADAEEVCREIVAFGGRASLLHLDVTVPLRPDIGRHGFNHLSYFATPKIFGKRGTGFDDRIHALFELFYVSAFETLIDAIGQDRLTVFYPSTTAIDEPLPELEEYAAAKRAGEILCRTLSEREGLVIHSPRLPRIRTDQTMTLMEVPAADPVDTMLPILLDLLEADFTKGTG